MQLIIGLASLSGPAGYSAEKAANPVEYRFKYERYDAQSGALYKSKGAMSYVDDLIDAVLVDSKGCVWVGTNNGLAVYDGKEWANRTFQSKWRPSVLDFLLPPPKECGPDTITEGPPGTIWFAGSGCGVWRFRDGSYSEISSIPGGIYLGTAVDKNGSLWVVTGKRVYKYNGQTRTEMLCPYLAHTVSYKRAKLFRIAIGPNGSVWIAGTAYGEPQGPWEHEGAIWVVDQEHGKRNDGPPMAPLFEFDEKRWKAYGPPHGLNVKQAIPELDAQGRISVRTREKDGYYVQEGDAWKPANEAEVSVRKRWILRECQTRTPSGFFAEMHFRDGENLVQVRPTDHETGEVFDLGTEQLSTLRMVEDRDRGCVWLGTMHGLYRIWRESQER